MSYIQLYHTTRHRLLYYQRVILNVLRANQANLSG